MQDIEGVLVLSPSDLVAFTGCEHRSHLDRLVATGKLERPHRDDPFLEVLRDTPGEDLTRVATAASEFFLEVLATFDMAQRGFHEDS